MMALVSGWRHYDRPRRPWWVMGKVLNWSQALDEPLMVIHGAAPGLDTIVDGWVRFWQASGHRVSTKPYPAQWKLFGKRAGVLRNSQMLIENLTNLDLAICFPHPEGSGTQDMMRQCREAELPVWEIPYDQAVMVGPPPSARGVPEQYWVGWPT